MLVFWEGFVNLVWGSYIGMVFGLDFGWWVWMFLGEKVFLREGSIVVVGVKVCLGVCCYKGLGCKWRKEMK